MTVLVGILAAVDTLNPAVSAAAVSGLFLLANTALVWWLTRERRRDGAENGNHR